MSGSKSAARSQAATDALLEQWRTADREAHKVEQALLQASLRALEGRAPVPSDEQREAARRLRRTADDLFQRSMDEFAALARAKGTDRGWQPGLL